jgi:hypothetical protein
VRNAVDHHIVLARFVETHAAEFDELRDDLALPALVNALINASGNDSSRPTRMPTFSSFNNPSFKRVTGTHFIFCIV